MKVVSKREIVELFLKEYYLPEAATVKAANAIFIIEEKGLDKKLIRIETLRDIESFMVRHIEMALKEDIKKDFIEEDFIKQDLFKTFGKEFIIAEDGTKVNKDDRDSYKLILEIIFSADKVREIIKENAREVMAIRIIMLKEKIREVIKSADIDNLYAIWKVRLEEIVENELKEFLEEIQMGNTEGISSMADFERILADRITAKLQQDIQEDFPELVLELFGERVIFEDADGEEVELDWDNVYEVIPPAIKEMIDEPIDEMARRLMEKPLLKKRQLIEQTVAPIITIRHISL